MSAIVPGSFVTVHGRSGDWLGYVRRMSDGKDAAGWVAVVDPRQSGLEPHSVHEVEWRRLAAPPRTLVGGVA